MKNFGFMRMAIEQAKHSSGSLKVGSVLVDRKRVVRTSFKDFAGNLSIHPEDDVAKGADGKSLTLYTTLEPCTYRNDDVYPCCDVIIGSKIRKVVIGLRDLNPRISGKSIRKLRSYGIKVEIFNEGLKKELMDLLGEDYIKKHGRSIKKF